MSPGRWLRPAALLLALGMLVAVILTLRVVQDGVHEMQLSDMAFNRGDVRTSLTHARRAAAAYYAPGAPHVRQAYLRLEAIAQGAETARDQDVAKAAWRAVRGAALESRHLWIPHRQELELANHQLARLEAATGELSHDEARRTYQDTLAALERARARSATWLLILVAGLGLVASGLAYCGWRGIGWRGELIWPHVGVGWLLVAGGIVCWSLAVLRT